MSDTLIDSLVELHGEGGLAPSREDWSEIMTIEGRVPLLNLLKFRPQLETDTGPVSGEQAYNQYTIQAGPAFVRAGGELLFFGAARHIFGSGVDTSWDAAILNRYPSAKALADMWLDPVFIEAHRNRLDSLERSQVLIFNDRA